MASVGICLAYFLTTGGVDPVTDLMAGVGALALIEGLANTPLDAAENTNVDASLSTPSGDFTITGSESGPIHTSIFTPVVISESDT